MKCLQENETSPGVSDTALRITMTWMTDNLHQNVEQSFPFSPVTASSKTSFPPGLSTLANSARVSELWTEELSARRQESTQSKVDAEWDAEERREDHFTPDFSIPALSAEHTSHF